MNEPIAQNNNPFEKDNVPSPDNINEVPVDLSPDEVAKKTLQETLQFGESLFRQVGNRILPKPGLSLGVGDPNEVLISVNGQIGSSSQFKFLPGNNDSPNAFLYFNPLNGGAVSILNQVENSGLTIGSEANGTVVNLVAGPNAETIIHQSVGGSIRFLKDTNEIYAIWDLSLILTSNKTFTLQNKTGILAMTDDNISQFTNDTGFLASGDNVSELTNDAGYITFDEQSVQMLFDYFTNTTVGGAEADIYTDTIAAGQLATNGEKLIAEYSGNFVTVGTELTQLKVYFAGTAIWDSTGIAPATGTSSWRVFVEIIRVSATVVRCTVSLNTTGASGFVYCTYTELTGLTLSGTNILKITGTSSGVDSGSGDIIGRMGYVQWKKSA